MGVVIHHDVLAQLLDLFCGIVMPINVRVAMGHSIQFEESAFMTVQELNDGLEISKLHGQDALLLQNTDLNIAIMSALCQQLMPHSDAIFFCFALAHQSWSLCGEVRSS